MSAPVISRLEKERVGNHIRTFDPGTGETIHVSAPIWVKDDFLQSGTLTAATTSAFSLRDTAGGAETFAADEVGGAISLALDATNEAQLAGIDFADQLLLSLNKGLNIEARIKVTSANLTGINFGFGVGTDHNAALGTVSRYCMARLTGEFNLDIEKDDNGDGDDDTAVRTNATVDTLVTATWYIFRLDFTNPAAPRFFLNGTEITLATALNLAGLSAAEAKVQPVVRVGKEAAATTLAVALVDYIAYWQDR